jgi:hypothetical protein
VAPGVEKFKMLGAEECNFIKCFSGEHEISRLQYKSVIPISSNSHSCSSDSQEYHYSDNIFLNSETQLQFTGSIDSGF